MALEREDRNRLQKLVAECRRLLEREYSEQLQSLYGIQPDGTTAALSELGHLDEEALERARTLRAELDHFRGYEGQDRKSGERAVLRLLREQSFTTLNRFAAMRLCEQREIILESIAGGYGSKGFKLFKAVSSPALGDEYSQYRVYLQAVFDELSIDRWALFDRLLPTGMLFPRERALLDLFGLLNDPTLTSYWGEDETIGWIYQYFNSKEERQELHKHGAPKNSRELAVVNQFFTPRYVVRFLLDNSLGRTWCEMTGGRTGLLESCELLVPPQDGNWPAREIKDPREIRMIDPACGSMHFGLYAFDLYERIYREAWDDHPELLSDLREEGMRREEFLRQVPAFILEHNLHGIDIDRRCVQIASFSLWLRAQRSWKEASVPARERPGIGRISVVCAEPMPGEVESLEEYTRGLKPAVLGDLVRMIWKEMRLAGEAGTLLRIEEAIEREVKKASTAWKVWTKDMGRMHQGDLFRGMTRDDFTAVLGYDVRDIESATEWDVMETRLLEALREYAEGAADGSMTRRLFAGDAVSGFAYIDACRRRYDVLVMNPPFGEGATGAKEYINSTYPRTKNDLAAAFVEMALARLAPAGYVGAITTRTIFFLSSHTRFREEIMLGEARPIAFADLGYGVLDAMVETAAYVVQKV